LYYILQNVIERKWSRTKRKKKYTQDGVVKKALQRNFTSIAGSCTLQKIWKDILDRPLNIAVRRKVNFDVLGVCDSTQQPSLMFELQSTILITVQRTIQQQCDFQTEEC